MDNTRSLSAFSKRVLIFASVILVLLFVSSAIAYADEGTAYLLYRGTSRVITAPFQGANTMISQSVSQPFPFGIVAGTLNGTMKAVTGVLSGAIDLVRGAAPYAKYAIFFL